MNRAFTLIEILVVVSIVGMLSSVVVASVAPARARARDTVRIQQVAQLNNAIELYKANKGHAPYLGGEACKVQIQAMTEENAVSACVAVSTQGVSSETPWKKLQDELSEYIKTLPNDPCVSNCTSSSGYAIGYRYVAPAAVQTFCASNCSATNDSYQVYAPLETNTNLAGTNNSSSGSGGGGTYYPPVQDTTPPSVPTNVTAVLVGAWPSLSVTISWDPSTDTGGSGMQGYKIPQIDLDGYQDEFGNPYPPNPTIPRSQYLLSWSQGMHLCYTVKAYDNDDNVSDESSPACVDVPYYYALPAPTNVTANIVGANTQLSWQYSYGSNPYFPITFVVFRDNVNVGSINVYTAQSPVSFSRVWSSPACWKIKASDSDYDYGPNVSDFSVPACTQ